MAGSAGASAADGGPRGVKAGPPSAAGLLLGDATWAWRRSPSLPQQLRIDVKRGPRGEKRQGGGTDAPVQPGSVAQASGKSLPARIPRARMEAGDARVVVAP